jgi:hypothetical protein
MLDALTYLKAARAIGVPAALDVSRSGIGAHAWIFFAAGVPAVAARRLGTGLLREAMALRGRMQLSSYDRLFRLRPRRRRTAAGRPDRAARRRGLRLSLP